MGRKDCGGTSDVAKGAGANLKKTWHELDWKALKKDGIAIVSTPSTQLQSAVNQLDKIVVTLSPQFIRDKHENYF
jgi:hypothetical protein